MNDERNLNEIFRKDVTYDNIKSHKKSGFRPLFRRYIFEKTTAGGQIYPPCRFRAKIVPFGLFISKTAHMFHVCSDFQKFSSFFKLNATNAAPAFHRCFINQMF